jgi:hypothetical protein
VRLALLTEIPSLNKECIVIIIIKGDTTTKNNTEKSIGIYRYYSTRDLGN